MQKIIFSALEAIRTLPGRHLIATATFLFSTACGLHAQQNSALGFIDSLTNIIVHQEPGSTAQMETVAAFRMQLYSELKKSKNSPEAERARLWVTIRNLELKQEEYAVLRPENRVSEQVLAYEKELKSLGDSIAAIQGRLISVIEHPASTVQTKEKAVEVLSGIHNEQVLEYLLKNEEKLRFGTIDPLNDDYGEESTRTAMHAIYNEYFSQPEVNWMVFPYLLQHVEEAGFSELGFVRRLHGYEDERFKAPWLLLEFMHANASPALKKVIEGALLDIEIPEERKK